MHLQTNTKIFHPSPSLHESSALFSECFLSFFKKNNDLGDLSSAIHRESFLSFISLPSTVFRWKGAFWFISQIPYGGMLWLLPIFPHCKQGSQEPPLTRQKRAEHTALASRSSVAEGNAPACPSPVSPSGTPKGGSDLQPTHQQSSSWFSQGRQVPYLPSEGETKAERDSNPGRYDSRTQALYEASREQVTEQISTRRRGKRQDRQMSDQGQLKQVSMEPQPHLVAV